MPMMPRVRRIVARRPWVQWVVVAVLATGVGATVHDAMARVDAARTAWGRTVTVWVATRDVVAGETIAAEPTGVPAAIRPPGAVDDPAGSIARQAIGAGEIVTALDLVDGEQGLAPAGWLIAPAHEARPSGAAVGERVQVASDGYVLTDEAVVVGFVDDVTLVAAPADVAAVVSGAADVTLLRSP